MKLSKLCSAIILTLIILAGVPANIEAASRAERDVRVVAYGKVMALSDKSVKRSNTVYIPLREVCESLGASVKWDAGNKLAIIHYSQRAYVPDIIILSNKAYARAEALKEIFGCSVETFYNLNIVAINQKDKPATVSELAKILPTCREYSKDDVEWLAKIVHAEAKGEDYESKLAVANVILNRMMSPMYPDTIKAVIFDNKSGIQFTPTVNGSIYNTPSAESYLAALEALEGNNNAQNALFFINPKIAKSSWVSRNREFAFALGNHNFYN